MLPGWSDLKPDVLKPRVDRTEKPEAKERSCRFCQSLHDVTANYEKGNISCCWFVLCLVLRPGGRQERLLLSQSWVWRQVFSSIRFFVSLFFFYLFCRCTLNACAATVQRLFLELMVVKIKSRMKFLFSPLPLLCFVDVCVLVIVLVCNACFCFLPWVLLSNHTFLKQRELLACRMDGWNSNAGIKKK